MLCQRAPRQPRPWRRAIRRTPVTAFIISGRISCATENSCLAIADLNKSGSQAQVVVAWNGTAWRSVAVPTPKPTVALINLGRCFLQVGHLLRVGRWVPDAGRGRRRAAIRPDLEREVADPDRRAPGPRERRLRLPDRRVLHTRHKLCRGRRLAGWCRPADDGDLERREVDAADGEHPGRRAVRVSRRHLLPLRNVLRRRRASLTPRSRARRRCSWPGGTARS